MKKILLTVAIMVLCHNVFAEQIDRKALVTRNNPAVHTMDTLSSFTVGNGEFAYTVDATGLQTFPDYYKNGVCLGTQSQWGWHAFPNTENFKPEEALKAYNFGHKSKKELYSCQFSLKGVAPGSNPQLERQNAASEYFRKNPHRLHLGIIGFDFNGKVKPEDIKDIYQTLNMWTGEISSHFTAMGRQYDVHTTCHPTRDMMAAAVTYKYGGKGASADYTPIAIRLPYPTGGHVDDAIDWNNQDRHTSAIVKQVAEKMNGYAVISHKLDDTTYYLLVQWQGKASFRGTSPHTFKLIPESRRMNISVEFLKTMDEVEKAISADEVFANTTDGMQRYQTIQHNAANSWQRFWTEGAAVDFSHCRDARAQELERRVVLSQYLLAMQSAGSMPPQETGLTMNSWFGKFHLEMILWHEAWLPLWGHPELLTKALAWYHDAEPMARQIAKRQGFDGVRWMKMTDPSAAEAPSNVGSFLIWQQPHLIYLAELAYRNMPEDKRKDFLGKFAPLIDETARFMYSFANYDKKNDRYILKGHIPAQESLKASVTYNSPFELNQWHYTMGVAQQWRERMGEKRNPQWDKLIEKLSTLAFNSDSLYLAAESAVDTYFDLKATSDHPALLGALGFFPDSKLIDKKVMDHTLDWIVNNWNWPTSWGWDFPMTAMTATRMLQPEKAVNSLLLNMQKNTYLNNGHNYQDGRLRIYLPGNGGLLSAVALMCAGWDGCRVKNPGFPKDGNWDVRWEGLTPMP